MLLPSFCLKYFLENGKWGQVGIDPKIKIQQASATAGKINEAGPF